MTENDYVIKWDEFPREKLLLSDHTINEFGRYFKGEYIRPQSLSGDLLGLNDFLRTINQQELEIFLKIRGKAAKEYIINKNFTEVLLYCIERTGPTAKRPLLFALDYILSKTGSPKDIVVQNIKIIENLANCDNTNLNGIAQSILQRLNQPHIPTPKPQYFLKNKQQYEFYKQLREIIKRAKSTIKFWDNYADHTILDYIDSYTINLKEIKIIFENGSQKKDLELSGGKFRLQYPTVNLEIKKSTVSHDRFLITENETWTFGPSLKDGGNRACVITQLNIVEARKLNDFFDKEWNNAQSIIKLS